MLAKLLIREVSGREFVAFNGNYVDQDDMTAAEAATAEGERICTDGNGEAFQVWELITAKQRVWRLEDTAE